MTKTLTPIQSKSLEFVRRAQAQVAHQQDQVLEQQRTLRVQLLAASELGLSSADLAIELGVTRQRVRQILAVARTEG